MASFPFMSVQESEHEFRRICSEMEDARNLHNLIVDSEEVMSGAVARPQLDNAQTFNVHRWSDYPEVKAATDAIFVEFQILPDFRGLSNITKAHIRVVLLNLYAMALVDAEKYVAYYRMKGMYDRGSRYNSLHISYCTVSVVDALRQLGYVNHEMGFFDRASGKSRMSRMRATNKLLDLIVGEYGFTPEVIGIAPDRECIILRDRDGKAKKQVNIEYQDTNYTSFIRPEVSAYNQLLASTAIAISYGTVTNAVVGCERPEVDLTDRFVSRIFCNGSWGEGGRFYGGFWQTLPKAWRAQITINGQPTTELDYSGLHIFLLYVMEGITDPEWPDGDPYRLDGYEQSERMREFLKLVLLVALNAKSVEKAVMAIRRKVNWQADQYGWLRDANLDVRQVIARFAEAHSPIRSYFFQGYGTTLQNIDAGIAARIINEMTAQGIPVLTVHDSFLVESSEFGALYSAMEHAIEAEMNDRLGTSHKLISRMKAKGYWAETINMVIEQQRCLAMPIDLDWIDDAEGEPHFEADFYSSLR